MKEKLNEIFLNCNKELSDQIKELYLKEYECKEIIWQRNDLWCMCDKKAYNVPKKVYEYHKERINKLLRKEQENE